VTISALRVLIVCCNGGLFLAGELLVLKTALGVSNSHRRRILNVPPPPFPYCNPIHLMCKQPFLEMMVYRYSSSSNLKLGN